MHGIGNTAEALRAQQNNKRQKGNPLSELTNLPNGRPLVKDEVCSSSNPLTQGPATTSTIVATNESTALPTQPYSQVGPDKVDLVVCDPVARE